MKKQQKLFYANPDHSLNHHMMHQLRVKQLSSDGYTNLVLVQLGWLKTFKMQVISQSHGAQSAYAISLHCFTQIRI